MVLQDKLLRLMSNPGISLTDYIDKCERKGIHLLFNQASTGRVSGITYFYGDFKIKGQALGNRFKWAELIKILDYEQGKDGQAICQANERTRGIYGDYTSGPAADTGGLAITDKTTTPNAGEFIKPTQDVAADGRDAAQSGEAAYSIRAGNDSPPDALTRSTEVVTILAAIMIGGILGLGIYLILK